MRVRNKSWCSKSEIQEMYKILRSWKTYLQCETFRTPLGKTSPGLKHLISRYCVPLSNNFSSPTNLWPTTPCNSSVPCLNNVSVLEQN